MGAEHHGLGRPLRGVGIVGPLRPARVGQNRHHVPPHGLGPFDRRLSPNPPAAEWAALRLERVVDPLLDRVEIPPERRLHDIVHERPPEVQDRHGAVLRPVARARERHQRVAVRIGVVAEDDAPGLVLRRVGHLAGQRRILRRLIAIEHAVRVVLLRLLAQDHDAGPLGGAAPLGGCEGRVVVVMLGGCGDAVAGEYQRQVESPGTTGGQRREVFAEAEWDRLRDAVRPGRPHQFGGVVGRGAQLRVERHHEPLEWLRGCRTSGHAAWIVAGAAGHDGVEADTAQLFGHPVGRLLDSLRARPPSLTLGSGQPLDRRLESLPQRGIVGGLRSGRRHHARHPDQVDSQREKHGASDAKRRGFGARHGWWSFTASEKNVSRSPRDSGGLLPILATSREAWRIR